MSSPEEIVTRSAGAEEPEPSFLLLVRVHEELNELFLAHQEALLEQDIARARERLQQYEHALLAHMLPEEEVLLPVYARAGAIPGGPQELFLGEHRKMREFLQRFQATLAELGSHPPDLRRRLIGLLDEQAMFKHLVEHHDLRERNILYPALDRVTTVEERRELLRICEESSKAHTLRAGEYNSKA